jgi:hypothetical protein
MGLNRITGNVDAAVNAATMAVRLPFSTFVPATQRLESVAAHVCTAMADDTLCACAHANVSVRECQRAVPVPDPPESGD